MKIVLLQLLIVLSSFKVADKNIEYKGTATAVKGNKTIYNEENTEIYHQGRHVQTITNYQDANGKVFAKRKLDYSKNILTPDFQLEDTRLGSVEGAILKGNEVQLFYKKNKSSPLKNVVLTIPKPFVIDGGFNYFIKTKWNELSKGDILYVNIGIPSQLDYFKFRVYKTTDAESNGKKEIVFRIEPDNFILRSILDPILTTYNKETHRMTAYKGISNICSEKGKYLLVNLNYSQTGP
jgi:hypothetical protein